MTISPPFDLNRFLALEDTALISYAEPFVTTNVNAVPEDVYHPIVSRLLGMDETHMVYALEMCMHLRPCEFVTHAVDFLTNPHASVCSTASRLIKSVPRDSLPAELKEKIAATPIVDIFAPDFRTGDPIRIGTNEALIRDIVNVFV